MPVNLERVINLRERSTHTIAKSDFHGLVESPTFSAIVEAGVLSLVRSKTTPYGIRAGALVGEAILENGTRVVIKEKVEGAVSALLKWALPQDVRAAEASSGISPNSPVLEAYSTHFLDHLSNSLRFGRVKYYVDEFRTSATPRGRINVAKSLSLLARGKPGLLSYRCTRLSADNLPNRLLALAIGAVEACASATTAPSLLERSRTYASLFEDVDAFTLDRLHVSQKANMFREVLSDSRITGDLKSAIGYARALVLHLGAWSEAPEELLPRTYFLNLEDLFEDAVGTVLSELFTGRTVKGREIKRTLFENMPRHYVVDPDIVLTMNGTPLLVIDCKYKELDGLPYHSDVYQLFSHCSALSVKRGILIYPGGAFRMRRLGLTASKVEIWWATVRTINLSDDLKKIMKTAYRSC